MKTPYDLAPSYIKARNDLVKGLVLLNRIGETNDTSPPALLQSTSRLAVRLLYMFTVALNRLASPSCSCPETKLG